MIYYGGSFRPHFRSSESDLSITSGKVISKVRYVTRT